MNIKEIYQDKGFIFEQDVAKMYNRFARSIENDDDYFLSDDEVSELFNELLVKYIKETTSEYEFNRITK